MSTYILKRFLQLIPVFLGATLLVYFLVFSLPGDPIVALFGDKPVNEAVAAKLRAQYHLDQPFWMQYLLYLKSIFTFDLGQDFSGRPIADRARRGLPRHGAAGHHGPDLREHSSASSSASSPACARASSLTPRSWSRP